MFLKNSLFSMAGSIIPLLITVVTLPLLLGAIGAERYGSLALCWLILIYSAQILDGIGTAITHAVARNGDDEQAGRDVMVTGLATALVVSFASAALAYAFAHVFFAHVLDASEGVRQELISSVWLIAACSFVSGVSRSVYGALIGKERFPTASIAMVVCNGGLPLAVLIAAQIFGPNMVVLLSASLTAYCLGLFLLLFDLWYSQLRGRHAEVSWTRSQNLLRFGFWIMATAILAPALLTLDRMMIGAQLGAIAVAAYTIPFQIISRLQLIPQSILKVLFPRLAVLESTEAQKMALHYPILMSAFFSPLIVGLILLLEPLMEIWLGSELDPRSPIIGIWLLCAFLLSAITTSMVVYLQSQGRGHLVAKIQATEIIPYFCLLLFFVSTFGLLGVVAAFFIRRAFEVVIFVWQSRLGARKFWKTQVPAMLGVIAAVLWVGFLDQFILRFLIAILLASATFIFAIWLFPKDLRAKAGARLRNIFRAASLGPSSGE